MGKLTFGTALPADYVTRAQFIAAIESLIPVTGEFCDGTTIVVTGGKLVIGTIAQSAVSGLVAALAAKAASNDWLDQLVALTTEAGVLRRTSAGDLEIRAQGAAVADVSDGPLPANGAIAALTFTGTPTGAECEALRDECENMRDVIAALVVTVESLRDRLKDTGGAGVIAD